MAFKVKPVFFLVFLHSILHLSRIKLTELHSIHSLLIVGPFIIYRAAHALAIAGVPYRFVSVRSCWHLFGVRTFEDTKRTAQSIA